METGEGMGSLGCCPGAAGDFGAGFCGGGTCCGGVCVRMDAAKSRVNAGSRMDFARTRTVLREIEKHQAEG